MCGRAYSTYTEEELTLRYQNKRPIRIPSLKPNYNLAPTQDALILRNIEAEAQFDHLRWQLVPPWEKEFKTKLSTINAKSETVFSSRLYKGAILKRRCIVPLSGFIEWKAEADAPKRPYCIFLKDQPIMSVAGIWETWHPGTPEERNSFAILTTEPNSFMEKIHNRMPVILSAEQEEEWLDSRLQDQAHIAKLLKSCPADWLNAYEVSTAINSPRNNSPEVLEPLEW